MTRPLLFALVLTLGPIGCQEITIVDNECDADEADLWFLDEDGDGFGITDDFIVA